MPENTKKIFTLSRLNDLTNKEIANELGISIKDVEYHISKALKYLRISLKDYLPLIAFMDEQRSLRSLSRWESCSWLPLHRHCQSGYQMGNGYTVERWLGLGAAQWQIEWNR